MTEFSYWTAADAAELDVLCFELARHSAEHRDHCEACQPCHEYEDWRPQRDSNPCSHLERVVT